MPPKLQLLSRIYLGNLVSRSRNKQIKNAYTFPRMGYRRWIVSYGIRINKYRYVVAKVGFHSTRQKGLNKKSNVLWKMTKLGIKLATVM